MKRNLVFSLALATLCTALPVHAQEPSQTSTAPTAPSTEQASRARFSGGRFVVESLVGLVVGSAAAYGAVKGICGDELCLGGALAGLGANIIATPLSVSLVGWGMGGQGTFGYAMLGEAMALGAGGSLTTVSPGVALGVGLALGPFASAGMFEARSHQRANGIALGGAVVRPYASPTLTPTLGAGATLGGAMGLTGQF